MLLFKMLPKTLSGPYGNIAVYPMFDEISSVTLLEESIAKSGLRGPNVPLTLHWYDRGQNKGSSVEFVTNVKSVILLDLNNG